MLVGTGISIKQVSRRNPRKCQHSLPEEWDWQGSSSTLFSLFEFSYHVLLFFSKVNRYYLDNRVMVHFLFSLLHLLR